jgi:hypothetical protein
LTLDGLEDAKEGVEIEGIRQALNRVAEKAGLPKARTNKLLTACDKVRWALPKGLSMLDLRMLAGSEPGLVLPSFAGADEVIVVSPFLGKDFVSSAAGWAKNQDSPRYLVSTEPELRKLAHSPGMPLAAFKDNLLILESPAPEDTDPERFVDDGAASSDDAVPDEELVVRGLHAKLFAVRHKARWQLWAGSANATTRAWSGANHELVALLQGDKAIGAGLHALLGTCRTVSLASLRDAPPAEQDEAQEEIERARKQISATYEAHLARNDDDFQLVGDSAFPPIPKHLRVQVALMTGSLLDWPTQSPSVALGKFDLADQTGLVQWRLSIDKTECRWLQALEVRPPLPKERDHAAIAARMTPSQFLAWIRSLLSGESARTGGLGSWKSEGPSAPFDPLAKVTLEEVLGSRARKGSRVAELDARIGAYLHYVMKSHAAQPELLAQLQEFSNLWQQVRTELLR